MTEGLASLILSFRRRFTLRSSLVGFRIQGVGFGGLDPEPSTLVGSHRQAVRPLPAALLPGGTDAESSQAGS